MGRGPRGLWNMGDVPFVKLFTKSIRLGISGLYVSVGFARFQHFTVAPTSRHVLSTMRERGPVGKLARLGAQPIEGEGVTLRRLCARGRERPQTAQGEERQGLGSVADFGGGAVACALLPRVALRPPCGGPRSTRGHIPPPLAGRVRRTRTSPTGCAPPALRRAALHPRLHSAAPAGLGRRQRWARAAGARATAPGCGRSERQPPATPWQARPRRGDALPFGSRLNHPRLKVGVTV